jgi:hypothetical protein
MADSHHSKHKILKIKRKTKKSLDTTAFFFVVEEGREPQLQRWTEVAEIANFGKSVLLITFYQTQPTGLSAFKPVPLAVRP